MVDCFVCCTSRSNPFVNFFFLEFPEDADFVGRHAFPLNPLVDRVSLDAEIRSDLVNGKPAILGCTIHARTLRALPVGDLAPPLERGMSDPYQSKPPDHIRFDSGREPADRANSGVGARRSSNFGRKLRFAGLEYRYRHLSVFGVSSTVFLTLRSNEPPLHFSGTDNYFLSFSKIPPMIDWSSAWGIRSSNASAE